MRELLARTGVFVLAVTVGGALAYGQLGRSLVAKVDFSFGVPGKTLPAGTYVVSYDSSNPAMLVIRSRDNKAEAMVPFVTRLAQLGTPADIARLVFDKVGNESYLSEVWIPGEDGFLLIGTKGKHSHTIVKGSK